MRPQPSPAADALWSALRYARDKGLTAGEAANRKLCSESYARRRLRVWAAAGFAIVEKGVERVEHDRYRIAPGAPVTAPAITRDETVIDKRLAMKAEEFAAIRRKLGLSAAAFGERLGWSTTSSQRHVRRFEQGRPIDAELAAKVRALVDEAG